MLSVANRIMYGRFVDTNLKFIKLYVTESTVIVLIAHNEYPLQGSNTTLLQGLRLLIKERSGWMKHCLLSIVEDLRHLQ
jgi:hypothetical protein